MTEDHAAEPSPSRTWAGIVDRPTFERFADAWQLHAEADGPSAVTEHQYLDTHTYTFDGMNWEAGGESPIVYVTVEVAVVQAGNNAETIIRCPFTDMADRPQTHWPGPGPTRIAAVPTRFVDPWRTSSAANTAGTLATRAAGARSIC